MRKQFYLFVVSFFASLAAAAQGLTDAQRATLRTFVCAGTARPAMLAGNASAVRSWLNSAGNFVVWRTDVSRADIYHQTSSEGTTWNWTTYKNQSIAEQNAWVQIFMGDLANFGLANLRAGVDAIFSGSGAPATQRAHIAAIAKRRALRVEQALATGSGTTATPATLSWEGALSEVQGVELVFKADGTLWGC